MPLRPCVSILSSIVWKDKIHVSACFPDHDYRNRRNGPINPSLRLRIQSSEAGFLLKILIVASWFPTPDSPVSGILFAEQAAAFRFSHVFKGPGYART